MKKRLISAIIMIIIAIPLLILGGIPFSLFILILGEACLFEFLKFRRKLPLFVKIISHLMLAITILKNLININLEFIIILDLFIFLSSLVFINKNYHYKDAFYLIGLILFLGIFQTVL